MVRPRSSLPCFKRIYFLDNIMVTVFVPIKMFFNTARKRNKYFTLVLILKGTVMQIETALTNDHLCVSKVQWTLSISTTLYLKLLSISNKKLTLLDICVFSKLFLSLFREPLYLEFFPILNKHLGPLRLFLSLSRTFSRLRVHLHSN